MPRRSLPAVLATLACVLVAAASASAAPAVPLPLGPATLPEARTVRMLAPGVTLTDIVRGVAGPGETFVVDAGFTLAPAEAAQTATQARRLGFDASVLQVDAHAPDSPLPGPVAYVARIGRFAGEAAAEEAAARLAAAQVPDPQVDFTGDDGTALTGGPWRVHVLDIDPRRFRGTVRPVLANGVVRGRETVSAIDRRTRALAGLNGGYFVTGPADGTPGDLAGISVVGGDLVSEAVDGRTALVLPHGTGAGARIEALSTTLRARSSDGAARLVDGRNRRVGLIRACGGRGGDRPTTRPLHDVTCTDPSELVQLTRRFGRTTPAGARVEAVVDRGGRVRALRSRRGAIPRRGYVLAGTGDGATWLRRYARPGRRVRVRVRVRRDTNGGGALALGRGIGVVNGGPRLLRAGAQQVAAAAEGFTHPGDPEFYYRFGVRRNPRTIAGVTAAGHLLLVAADGRAPGYSVGLSFLEEAAVMRALGASDAVNLDGGGSTTMVVGATAITRPSDPTGERPVGDAVVVAAPRG
jgi:hypothetical protein